MKTGLMSAILALSLVAGTLAAQSGTQPLPPTKDSVRGREPPAQAYEDCKGKKAGDAVQHTTPEGKVDATCAESPKGLVARPNRPKGS